jgi:hypothetical protein
LGHRVLVLFSACSMLLAILFMMRVRRGEAGGTA